MHRVAESVSGDKEIVKEVKQMSEYLKASDKSPDEVWQPEQATMLLGNISFLLFHIHVLFFFNVIYMCNREVGCTTEY